MPSRHLGTQRAHWRRVPVLVSVLATCVCVAGLALAVAFSVPAFSDDLPGEVTNAIPMPAIKPGFPVTAGSGFQKPPMLVDLDQDHRYEILAVEQSGVIHVIQANGTEPSGWPAAMSNPPIGPLAVGDLNHDGFPEVVAVTTNGVISGYSFNGGDYGKKFKLPALPIGGPVLVEVDAATGDNAVVVATVDGKLYSILSDLSGSRPGFPVINTGAAASGAFTFVGADNYPRIGILQADSNKVAIRFTFGTADAAATFKTGYQLGTPLPVSGSRMEGVSLPDGDHLYVFGAHGQLSRLDPDVATGSFSVVNLAGIGMDVLGSPALVDVNDDLVPEVAVLGVKGDTLNVFVLNGADGSVRSGWPKRYIPAPAAGGIVAADLGDASAPEIIFNRGDGKITALRSNDATEAWTLSGLSTVVPPTVGDLDGDEGADLGVVTTDGKIYAYTLGTGGVGKRGLEWPSSRGGPRSDGQFHARDRGMLHPLWPPAVTPVSAFLTRPVIANVDKSDVSNDVVYSDYASGKAYAWNLTGGTKTGWHADYLRGGVLDAPAVGDVTGDGNPETVNGTSSGQLVWNSSNGVKDFMTVDNNRQLSPPALADINGDGTQDVVVGSSANRLYAVNLKNKTIIPGFPVTVTGAITLPAAVGDITGDGLTDIVVANGGRYITAFARTGGAPLSGWPKNFLSGQTLTQPILVPIAGQAGLAVAFGQTSPDSVKLHVVGGNGSPKAGWPRKLVGANLWGPIAGDFDNNGTPDFVVSTSTDSVYVFKPDGGRAFARLYNSPGNVEVTGLVDLDLDLRPEIVAVSDQTNLLGIRFNGLLVRSFTRMIISIEPGTSPAFGDLGNDGVLDMAASDLGFPILYSWGFGSWNPNASPWPLRNHDAFRTNAFAGLTVVDAGDPNAPPAAGGVAFATAQPNPTRGAVMFSHSRPLVGAYEAVIYDVRGRRVREVARGEAPAMGEALRWVWDGRDEGGVVVPPGIYFYRVADRAGAMRQKVVRLD
jgi:hypothetical protein